MSANEKEFWDWWVKRFIDEHEQYITPDNHLVKQWTSGAKLDRESNPEHKALKAWDYVHERIDYKLSRKWKTPEETIQDSEGDCEDVTFLIASMLASDGVEKTQIGLGELVYPDQKKQLHTWNVVNDTVIDATGVPDGINTFKYDEKVDRINVVLE